MLAGVPLPNVVVVGGGADGTCPADGWVEAATSVPDGEVTRTDVWLADADVDGEDPVGREPGPADVVVRGDGTRRVQLVGVAAGRRYAVRVRVWRGSAVSHWSGRVVVTITESESEPDSPVPASPVPASPVSRPVPAGQPSARQSPSQEVAVAVVPGASPVDLRASLWARSVPEPWSSPVPASPVPASPVPEVPDSPPAPHLHMPKDCQCPTCPQPDSPQPASRGPTCPEPDSPQADSPISTAQSPMVVHPICNATACSGSGRGSGRAVVGRACDDRHGWLIPACRVWLRWTMTGWSWRGCDTSQDQSHASCAAVGRVAGPHRRHWVQQLSPTGSRSGAWHPWARIGACCWSGSGTSEWCAAGHAWLVWQ